MRNRTCCVKLGLLLVSLLFVLNGAFAQAPSLAASDQFVVTVETENGDETFGIIRDGRIEEQFYYLPIKPVIASQKVDGKNMPVFQLMSYQTKDKDDNLVQGGILQMSMVMGVPQETVDKLLKKIKSGIRLSTYKSNHRLSPMPIKSAELTLYDMDGDMLDQAAPKGGVAPIFGTQHYPFMLKLKDLGTDVMEGLCRKQGGLPVLITYTFSGMTPKVGFEVEVDWDACYKHFSTDTNIAISAAKNAVSGDLGLDISTLREEFESKGLIKINSLSDETFSAQQLDELMGPVLNLITVELFEQIHAPTSISPAEAREIKDLAPKSPVAEGIKAATEAYKKLTGKFFSVNAQINFALKDVKIVKKGKFTYKFHRQSIIDRTSSFGGLLGIGNYPKEVQDKCITTMPTGKWESAYFVLPAVGDPEALGITTLDISVTPEEKNVKTDKWAQITGYKVESAGFNKKNSPVWTDKNTREITRFLYPLKALYEAEGFAAENYRFKVDTIIKPKTGKSIQTTTYMPLFDGDLPIAPPSDLVDLLTIDGSCLTYGEEAGQVFKAVGQLKAGKLAWGINLTSDNPVQTFLVPSDEKNITVTTLKFAQKTGLLGNWKACKADLRELDPGLWFMVFDGDWQEEADYEKLPADVIMPSPL